MSKPLTPTPIPKLLGIHNTKRPERLPFGACSDAVNVLVDDTFTLEKREGYVLSAAFTNATDAYSAHGQDALFVVADNVLSSVSNTLTLSTLQSGLTDTVFHWAELGDRVFYAGTADAGVLVGRSHWQPLRIPQPVVTVTTPTGAYTAGQYQVTATYLHTATGIEGPAAPIQRIDVASGKTLDIAVPALSGYTTKIYVSTVNGSIPYCSGVPLSEEQINAYPLPTGITSLSAEGGVLYASIYDATNDVSFVFWSQPFYHQCWRVDIDYLAVPGSITGMVHSGGGLLITTTQACWLWANDALAKLADYGVPSGRPMARDHEGRWWVWTDHGLCTLTAEGWKNLTAEHVSVPPGTSCTAHVFERKGHSYFLVSTNGLGAAANAYTALAGTAWAVNLNNAEMTRFSNFPFLAFVHLQGNDYGLKAGGLYRLTGTTDASSNPNTPTPIVASFTTQPTDFGSQTIKRCSYAYLAGCDTNVKDIAVICDGIEVGHYTGQRRAQLARGTTGQYWAFTVSDAPGGDLRLTALEFLVEPTSRRI